MDSYWLGGRKYITHKDHTTRRVILITRKKHSSPPTRICPARGRTSDNCDFIEITRYLPKHERPNPNLGKSHGVATWFCTRCKRYATAGYYTTGASFNYDIRICDIEGTMMYFWKQDFPTKFVQSNEHLWKWHE